MGALSNEGGLYLAGIRRVELYIRNSEIYQEAISLAYDGGLQYRLSLSALRQQLVGLLNLVDDSSSEADQLEGVHHD